MYKSFIRTEVADIDKKTEIQTASQSLFSRFGLKKVTTDDIAREASVSKATVYKIYSNKSEIFDDVVRLEAEQLLEAVKEAVAGERTVEGKFRAHLLTKFSKLGKLVNFYHVTSGTSNEHWPHIEAVRRDSIRAEQEILVGILEGGIASGELDIMDVNLTAQMMIISLKAQEYEWMIDTLDVSLEQYVDLMVTVMLNGIRKR
jgi:AcrR family transcriptional regulator